MSNSQSNSLPVISRRWIDFPVSSNVSVSNTWILAQDDLPNANGGIGNTFRVTLPTVVQFASNTGSIQAVTWGWLFGDGTYSLDSDPVHKYVVPGNVSATFIAVDASNTIYSNTQILTITA